jgi:hypothetical protein
MLKPGPLKSALILVLGEVRSSLLTAYNSG